MQDKAKEILEAAVELAVEKGFRYVTRDSVAERARVSGALVNRYWGTHQKLLDKVVATAIERQLLGIVGQAMVDRHPLAIAAPRKLQERAAGHLIHAR